jgi:hypothetical protein
VSETDLKEHLGLECRVPVSQRALAAPRSPFGALLQASPVQKVAWCKQLESDSSKNHNEASKEASGASDKNRHTTKRAKHTRRHERARSCAQTIKIQSQQDSARHTRQRSEQNTHEDRSVLDRAHRQSAMQSALASLSCLRAIRTRARGGFTRRFRVPWPHCLALASLPCLRALIALPWPHCLAYEPSLSTHNLRPSPFHSIHPVVSIYPAVVDNTLHNMLHHHPSSL